MSSILQPIISSVKHKGLLAGFVRRELKGRFAGTIAGLFWAFLNPLAMMLAYLMVFSVIMRMQVQADEVGTDSFWVFFLTGLFPWLIFSDGLNRATGVLVDNANLITKVVFPVELLPVSSVISSLVINGIGMIIFLAYLAFINYSDIIWLMIPLVMAAQIVFTLGLAMFLSALCVFIRDVRELMGIVIMLWFFSTPILYPLSFIPQSLAKFIKLNPITWYVQVYREILLLNEFNPLTLLPIVLTSLCVYTFGTWFFMRSRPGFGDVL